MGKLQTVSELADRTAREVARDVQGWKQYLDTASRLYKYKFDEQLLIYAQRPDATACAGMEVWNEKMRRWVKAGSKGIAIIRGKENGRPHLEYVFDVADTRPVRGAREPYLWEMREEHHGSVLAALKERYGEGSRKELGGRLMEAAAAAIGEACPEYLRGLAYDAGGSSLERPGLSLAACFRDTLTASVQYSLLTRCGLAPSDYLEDRELAGITEFSTPAMLHHLGSAVSALSMEILQEIGKAIRNYDREMMAGRQKNIQKTAENPLAKSTAMEYTKATGQFNDLKRESKEGGIGHGGTGIQEEWGLPDTGAGAGRGGGAGGNANREVRDAAPELPPGEPSGDIHIHAVDGEADTSPAADRRAGTGAGREDGGRDDETAGSGRAPERTRPDGMGAGGEQPDGAGGRSGASGDRLPVGQEKQKEEKAQETAGEKPAVSAPAYFQMSLFPTVEEQAERIAQAQKRNGELTDAGRFLNPKEMASSEYEKIRLARSIYAFYYYCPNTPNPNNSREWDVDAAERDFKPMLEDKKLSAALYEDMLESFATVTPEDTRSYGIMQRAIEEMGAYQRGEYSLFTPLPEEAMGREGQKREAVRKEAKEKQSATGEGKEPLGELKAAARALAKKQKNPAKGRPGQVKEGVDGQLSFDFLAENGEDGRKEAGRHTDGPDVPQWTEESASIPAPEGKEAQGPKSADMEEAKRLIGEFCLKEYNEDSVDFTNLEEVGIAYGATENGGFEVQVNVDLLHFSLSQFVDGECVEKREYGSLRELVDGELAFLDYDQLVYVEPHIEERLMAGLNEKIRWEEMQGAREGVFPTESENAGREEEETPDMVETEGGQVFTTETVGVYSKGLPYEIVVEKLHTGPDRSNFHITDDDLGAGGQKTKYQNNLAAIRTLKQIEGENRLATPQEQEILSKYVGWGGLSQAFDAGNGKWGKEYAELKELLTPEEYGSARGTVLNAHYTSPAVIKAMYEAVKRMDFAPGNILEPSCGIGNFFGLVPEGFGKANLYGVELDLLAGRIARQLYQRADITVGGFEATDYPDDFFDLAVGNVPFGEYKVHDRKYDKQNLLIHDYFLIKTLDKVRPGGVAAFITSKGTMDKANGKVREALAQKADLLGAIRLPNNAFKANAGTKVTADILFFQKRGSAPERLPDWVKVGQTADGVPLNNYYLQHPEMVLGRMEFWENMYGNATETACIPVEGADLKEQLAEAVTHIGAPDKELLHMDAPGQAGEEGQGPYEETIPADPHVRNFSFTEKGGEVYFRENSRMKRVEVGKMAAARIRGMIEVRDSARRLIDLQLGGADDAQVGEEQARLNTLYDRFQEKYGLLSSAGNRLAFRQDSSYPLLCSLEVLDEEGNLKRKADMFTKRTILHRQSVTSVDTAVEALGVSIGERACVDLGFMASLMGGGDKTGQIISDLKGIIFKDPESGPAVISEENPDWHKGWQTADEYLSGDVRGKLEKAKEAAQGYPEFIPNVEALTAVQPKDLTAPEISVRIGAPWIDTKYYKQFLFELLNTPGWLQNGRIDILYSNVTGEWKIKGKSEDSFTNTRVHATYGTKLINAYEIFQASLNQRSVQVFETATNADGKRVRVLNGKETAIAQQKQDAMEGAFHDWIFKDPERRADLCAVYNRMFNSIRPREYDGQHINFIGMNPEIKLEPHQRNAVARILYGGNTLLAHVVGAGKTYEMIAAAMEGKRLGLCRKSIMVVPNHLTEQWGGDFLTLYPGAKVLVATKKDFEPRNRRKFCARIATGDFDAVIIGHSQFEKIPISSKRQAAIIQEQIDEIVEAIAEAKENREEKFTVKQMERTKKDLEGKIQKLYDKKKDDTVTFEELGVDRLFVDEAHSFKNLYMHTKMRNVAGISQTDAQKSSDMFAKCRYMDDVICCEL